MKIFHITNWLPYYHKKWGGAEQAHYRLMKLLSKKGFKNYVLTETPSKIPEEDFEFYSTKTIESYFGEKLRKYSLWTKFGLLSFDPFAFITSYKLLKKIRPQIVHLHNFNILSFSTISAAKILRIPIVLSIYDYWYFCPKSTLFKKTEVCKDFHGSYCAECLFSTKFNFLAKIPFFLRKPLFNFFLSKIDAFIVLSESSSQIIQRYGIDKKKIYKIPLIFSLKEIPYNKRTIKSERKTILYVGWLVIHKGLHIAIKAMPKILEKFPDSELIVIGDSKASPEYVNKIKEMIKELKIEKNVKILGKVPNKILDEYINKAYVHLVLEQWENMSPVILVDSMFLEKSIVASRIGGIPEFIEDGKNGLLFEASNSEDLAKKVVYLLENKEKAEKIGKNAKEKILSLFDEEELFKKLNELYQKLLK